MNFHKEIVELQAVRKSIDKKSIAIQDYNGVSANLSDISYSITIAIKDLIRINKILKND